MFCEECGSEIERRSKFCSKCGTTVIEEEEYVAKKVDVDYIEDNIYVPEESEAKAIYQENSKEDNHQEATHQQETSMAELEQEKIEEETNEKTSQEQDVTEKEFIDQETMSADDEAAIAIETPSNKVHKKKKGVIIGISVAISIISILLLVSVSFFVYIFYFPYKTEGQTITIEKYINENKAEGTKLLEDGTIEFTGDSNILKAILVSNKDVIAKTFSPTLQIDTLLLDIKNEKVYMNAKNNKIKFPFSADISYKIKDNELNISLSSFKLGILNIAVPDFIYDIFLHETRADVKIALNIPKIFNTEDIEVDDDEIVFNLSYNYDELAKEAKQLSGSIDRSSLNTYIGKDAIGESLYYIFSPEGGMANNGELYNQLLNLMNLNKEQSVLPKLLALLDDKGIEYVKTQYGMLLDISIFQKEIKAIKEQIDLDKIANESKALFNAIEQYFYYGNNPVGSSQGKLYDTANRLLVTPQLLKDQGILDSNISTFNDSYIVFDGQEYKVIYVRDDQYIEISMNGGYTQLTKSEFDDKYAMLKEDYGVATKLGEQDTNRQSITEAIRLYNYSDTPCYVRFLKADQKYAYAITSLGSNYEQIDQYLLKNDNNNWTVLKQLSMSENTMQSISYSYPEVNMDIMPSYNVADYITRNLSGTEYVMNRLIEEKFITSENGYKVSGGVTFVYASWIQNGLFVETSTGRRFFNYVTNDNHVTDILEVKNQGDIDNIINKYSAPEIIFLQY